MNKLSQAYNYHTLPKSPNERSASDEQYTIRKEEQVFKELEQKLEREQAKKEREFQEQVFADCDKWDNRELGADEEYAKKADMRFGVMVRGGERCC